MTQKDFQFFSRFMPPTDLSHEKLINAEIWAEKIKRARGRGREKD